MGDCCAVQGGPSTTEQKFSCPQCGQKGREAKLITLKSLLMPEALAKLAAQSDYRMCLNRECPVVYFNATGGLYLEQDLKVRVFLKSDAAACPVCYCFGWTREKLKAEIEQTGQSSAVEAILAPE